MKQQIDNFLNNNALYIALGFVAIIVITIAIFYFVNRKKKSK